MDPDDIFVSEWKEGKKEESHINMKHIAEESKETFGVEPYESPFLWDNTVMSLQTHTVPVNANNTTTFYSI